MPTQAWAKDAALRIDRDCKPKGVHGRILAATNPKDFWREQVRAVQEGWDFYGRIQQANRIEEEQVRVNDMFEARKLRALGLAPLSDKELGLGPDYYKAERELKQTQAQVQRELDAIEYAFYQKCLRYAQEQSGKN